MHTTRLAPLLAVAAGALSALVLSAEAAIAGGGCHQERATEGQGDEVRMEGQCFQPTVLHVAVGTDVSFDNLDDQAHNVGGINWGSYYTDSGDDGILVKDESFTHTFRDPGYYPFACTLHAGMVGLIVVGDPEDEGPTTRAKPELQPDEDAVASLDAAATRGSGFDASGWGLVAGSSALAIGLVGAGAIVRSRGRRGS
jgi:plastocyanin